MGAGVPRPPFRLARVVGEGPLGATLAVALRARAAAREVDLVTGDHDAARCAAERGIAAAARASLLAGDPDAVFLTGPDATTEAGFAEWARRAPGSLLQEVAAAPGADPEAAARACARCPGLLLVTARPQRAPAAGDAPAESFLGIPVTLCAPEGVPPTALAAAERAWRLLGAEPERGAPAAWDPAAPRPRLEGGPPACV